MIYRKSENVELNFYEDSSFYNKYTMALDDSESKIRETIQNLFTALFGTIAGLTSFYVMIQIDKLTIVFMIAPLLGNFYFAPKLNTLTYSRYKDSVHHIRKTEYVNRVMYLADYAKELRLSNIYNVLERDYNKSINSISSLWRKYFKKSFILGIFQYVFSYVIIFEGILLYGAYRALVDKDHPITLAQMAVLTSVMVTASWVWLGVIEAINTCAKNALYMKNLRSFLEYKEAIPEDYDGIMPPAQIESIEFKNVSFSYNGKHKVISNMSFKIDRNTAIGTDLSGGEAQKLAASRAFYKQAGMLILDEPSSALDPIAEYQLNLAMHNAATQKTVIFISHRLSTTRKADRIYLLDNGRIIEEGTHEELLSLDRKYKQMWTVQAGRYIS